MSSLVGSTLYCGVDVKDITHSPPFLPPSLPLFLYPPTLSTSLSPSSFLPSLLLLPIQEVLPAWLTPGGCSETLSGVVSSAGGVSHHCQDIGDIH